jgi:hypothetical protein
MSTAAPPRPTNAASLPEDKFWRHYSPHHEFSLSSVGSFALHVLILGLAALACMIPFISRNEEPMPLTAVTMLGDNGGQLDGDEHSRGQNADLDGQQLRPDEKSSPLPQVPKVELPSDAQPMLTPLPKTTETNPDRTIQQITEFFDQGGKRAKDPNTTRGPDDKPAKGDGPRDPGGKPKDVHECRRVRWIMHFSTRDGEDYAKQLRSLGATIAVELADEPKKMTVYRDLTSPAKGEVEEIKAIQRIWWIDDKEESVTGLFSALKIKTDSKRLIAFFPEKVEGKLLKLELAYAKGKGENELVETVFELKHKGEGKYEPEVIRQR